MITVIPEKPRRPKDLGNDHYSVRTNTDRMVRVELHKPKLLTDARDRAALRRFAQRILDICDFYELKE